MKPDHSKQKNKKWKHHYIQEHVLPKSGLCNFGADFTLLLKSKEMKIMRPCLLLGILILSVLNLTSCIQNEGLSKKDALASHIDYSINPGDDFFNYANGKWFSENPIPATESSNGIFQLIADTVSAQVRKICESSASFREAESGSERQKIGDFYRSGMDSARLNSKGIEDVRPLLEKIDNANNTSDIIGIVSWMYTIGSSPLFTFYISQDDKNSSKYAIFLQQGGLHLPERSFYFDSDNRSVQIREEFVKHLAKMYGIMGYDPVRAGKAAEAVMKLETEMAFSSRKMEDLRDPFLNYNKLSAEQLGALAPEVKWNSFMDAAGLENVDTVIVGQPEFYKALDKLLKNYPVQILKDYLKFDLLSDLAPFLNDETGSASFNFYSTVLYGVQTQKPRWHRVVNKTNSYLGELIGQVYVSEYLPAGTKEKLLEIGGAIRNVYAERIKGLDWMCDATKEKALIKLNGIIFKFGYPDKWKDMSSVEIDSLSYVNNIINVRKWYFNYMISKFGKPVDRTEWGMQPQTYNAYYNPANNEICIPGCNIIVPGYERVMADDAILYAIIGGSTIGHEITHGFDDQGSKYDANGNLKTWWTVQDSINFYRKTKQIVEQFNAYIPVDSLHINGEATQGENIADLGGVTMGYQAFSGTEQYKKNKKIAGLTPVQRYFLGYAMGWMLNARPESLANQVRSDVHSPAKYRVIGPLSDIPEFYKAFGIKEGDFMWRPDSLRVKIW